MSRLLGVVIVAAMCAGCRSSAPVYDPFMGRTTVPPPGTAVVQPGQPYYSAPPAGATTSPPLITPPPGASATPPTVNNGLSSSFTPNVSPVSATNTAPTATVTPVSATVPAAMPATPGAQPLRPAPTTVRPIYGPPGGGLVYPPTSAAPIGAPAATAQSIGTSSSGVPTLANPATAPNATVTGVKPASFNSPDVSRAANSATPVVFNSSPDQNPIRIVEPPHSIAPPACAPHLPPPRHRPRTLNQSLSFRVPEITDLPPANSAARPAPAAASTAANESAGGYGYDPQYHWLKGKLEYSQSTRSWRLRYIPPDGNTDSYGGSVVLADNSQLAGLQPGDAVYRPRCAGRRQRRSRQLRPAVQPAAHPKAVSLRCGCKHAFCARHLLVPSATAVRILE